MLGAGFCATPLIVRTHDATAQDISQGVKALGTSELIEPKHTSKGQHII